MNRKSRLPEGYKFIPYHKESVSMANRQRRTPNSVSKGGVRPFVVALLILLSFFAGYSSSKFFSISPLDTIIEESHQYHSIIDFSLSVERDDQGIHILIQECRFSDPIILAKYSINDRKEVVFNITSENDLDIIIPREFYQFLNLGINNTNIVSVYVLNSLNISVSKSIEFSL